MDTGTGNIFPMDEVKIEDVKGDLIQWKVGEEVECRGCRFRVEEIQTFPFNTIILKGIPKLDVAELKELKEETP